MRFLSNIDMSQSLVRGVGTGVANDDAARVDQLGGGGGVPGVATNNLILWGVTHVGFGQTGKLQVGTNRIEVIGSGLLCELMAHVVYNGAATRYNGIVRIRKNGSTFLPGSGRMGYVRNNTGHNDASLIIVTFDTPALNDYYEVLVDRESTNGSTVNSNTADTVFSVKAYG